jgi:serine/threonine protein kinase
MLYVFSLSLIFSVIRNCGFACIGRQNSPGLPEFQTLCIEDIVKCIHQKDAAKYTNGNFIGEGASCRVFCVRLELKSFAVKCINLEKRNKDSSYKEVKLLSFLNHPHILKLHLAYKTRQNILLIITDYYRYGTISDFVNIHPSAYSILPGLLRQIADALNYLHKCHIVHRDVKPENIVVSETHACLIDLGFCSKPRKEPKTFKKRQGSLGFTAPDILIADQRTRYTCKADIWSFGMTLFALYCGDPFYDIDSFPVFAAELFQHQGPIDFMVRMNGLGHDIIIAIESCLKMDPEFRPSAKELLSKPYFTSSPGDLSIHKFLNELK